MQTLRVLVVEQKGLEAARLKAVLQSLGHQVAGVARDGWEAAALVGRLQPSLVIMGMRLPMMNGIEAARTILTRQAIPIVLLTGYASGEVVRQAMEAGVMTHLVKPVDRRGLRSAIEAALARFGELQSLRQEVGEGQAAVKSRELLEQAKRVLMRWSMLSEAEAFQRMEQYRRGMGAGLQAVASRIVEADELLFRKGSLAHWLQVVLRTVRRAEVPGPGEVAGSLRAYRFRGGWRQRNALTWEG